MAHPAAAESVDAVLAVAEHLCARATLSGDLLPARPHGEVALELRAMLPLVDDATFDQHLARIDVIAGHVTAAETAVAEPAAYEAAAEAAGLDPFDFPRVPRPRLASPEDDTDAEEELRVAVIEHWDLELRREVAALVAANDDPAQWHDDVPEESRPARSA